MLCSCTSWLGVTWAKPFGIPKKVLCEDKRNSVFQNSFTFFITVVKTHSKCIFSFYIAIIVVVTQFIVWILMLYKWSNLGCDTTKKYLPFIYHASKNIVGLNSQRIIIYMDRISSMFFKYIYLKLTLFFFIWVINS